MAQMEVNNSLAVMNAEVQVKADIKQESVVEQPVEKKRKRKPRVKSAEHILRMKKNRRDRANDRERNRMHSLNDALEELREILPNGAEGKMTKIETLRTAYNYIWALSQTVKMLDTEPEKISFMKMDNMNGENCVAPTNFMTNNSQDLLSTFSSMCSSPQLASPGSDTSDYSSQYDSQFHDSPVYSPHYQGQFYPSDSVHGNYVPAMPYHNTNKIMYSFPSNPTYPDFVDII